ncbi:MAG: addiction module protein [Desulfomonilaceae bacterium]
MDSMKERPSPPLIRKEKEVEIMRDKLDEIITAALQLNIEERAQLAGRLLLSLDEPSESGTERLWLEEAERRLNDFREGRVRGIPAEEVFQKVMDDIS